MEPELVVPDHWIDAVAEMETKFCAEIRDVDPKAAVLNLVEASKVSVELVQPLLGVAPRPKILEIGSGYGFGLCRLRRAGLDAIGIEPGDSIGFEGRFHKATELLEANGLIPATQFLLPAFGENLPFADETFDIVFTTQVLEHVRDVERCVREAFRVAKPGGVVFIDVPNYDSFYEGHYDILWLPYLLRSKGAAKWYVRTLFHRSDYFIDELNFLRPPVMRALMEHIPECGSWKMKLIGFHSTFGRPFYRLWQSAKKSEDRLASRAVLKGLELLGLFSGMHIECRKRAHAAAIVA